MNTPQPFSISEIEISVTHFNLGQVDADIKVDPATLMNNMREQDVIFRQNNNGHLQATIWGMAKPVEITFRGTSNPHGSLTVTTRTNDIILPVSADSPPDSFAVASLEHPKAKIGFCFIPTMEGNHMELLISLMKLSEINADKFDEANPHAIEALDGAMTHMHILGFIFNDNKQPDKFFHFNSGKELIDNIEARKASASLFKAA